MSLLLRYNIDLQPLLLPPFAPPNGLLLYPPIIEPDCRCFGKRLVAVDCFVSLQIIREVSGAV